MSRYRGPRVKKIRRLNLEFLPGLSQKRAKRDPKRPKNRRGRKVQYLIRLEEKQKLRLHYGITERQLLNYVRIARRAKGETGQVLLQLLEMRLDNILFRLGMAPTIPAARQLVNHRHILVNGRIVDIPNFRCKPQDTIIAKDDQKSRALIKKALDSSSLKRSLKNRNKKEKDKMPKHLTLHAGQYKGLVHKIIDRESVGLEKISELLVVEFYSRQT
uniref:Small ribosomal subunit protein uS4c n=1 Tax=Hypertelis spergulacea TaxID=764270 RepID=A0A411L8W1_9CARY|nr:ribosomal protein S4 [Hypertelis spergulacea]